MSTPTPKVFENGHTQGGGGHKGYENDKGYETTSSCTIVDSRDAPGTLNIRRLR